ncbi:hypothetical protein AB0M61_33815 [Streptomyces sp. NPDC051642]|uniref:hypothetical protein n=1 Tax=Streptomyces sp. NPDC051642 TaxID=3154646 RepID=UPI00342657CC
MAGDVCGLCAGTGEAYRPVALLPGFVGACSVAAAFARPATLIRAGGAAGSAVAGPILDDFALPVATVLGACGVTGGAVLLALSPSRFTHPVIARGLPDPA